MLRQSGRVQTHLRGRLAEIHMLTEGCSRKGEAKDGPQASSLRICERERLEKKCRNVWFRTVVNGVEEVRLEDGWG